MRCGLNGWLIERNSRPPGPRGCRRWHLKVSQREEKDLPASGGNMHGRLRTAVISRPVKSYVWSINVELTNSPGFSLCSGVYYGQS